jgi:hypothetical protein
LALELYQDAFFLLAQHHIAVFHGMIIEIDPAANN